MATKELKGKAKRLYNEYVSEHLHEPNVVTLKVYFTNDEEEYITEMCYYFNGLKKLYKTFKKGYEAFCTVDVIEFSNSEI